MNRAGPSALENPGLLDHEEGEDALDVICEQSLPDLIAAVRNLVEI
jgi:hypothetical protein